MKTEVSGEQNRTADSKELHCLNVPIRQKTNLCFAGRDSVVATVDGAHADHGEVRRCVALAVLYCESRRPPPFECGLREGVDYFVERAEE